MRCEIVSEKLIVSIFLCIFAMVKSYRFDHLENIFIIRLASSAVTTKASRIFFWL